MATSFSRSYWLTPTVELTPATKLSDVHHFCTRQRLDLSDEAARDARDKREILFDRLKASKWPEGKDAFLEARRAGGWVQREKYM